MNINKINFTGYKNASAVSVVNGYIVDGGCQLSDKRSHIFCCELTDDHNGKDLSEYVKQRSKLDSLAFKNEYDINFINIASVPNLENGIPDIYLNGVLLNPQDNSLGMFSFCAKLLKKIVPSLPNQVNNDYLMSNDFCSQLLIPPEFRNSCSKKEYRYYLESVVDDENIREHAKLINEDIMTVMLDYLA